MSTGQDRPIVPAEPNRGGDLFPEYSDDERPASIYDLDRINWQLSRICNDPDLTMVSSNHSDIRWLDVPEAKAEWE